MTDGNQPSSTEPPKSEPRASQSSTPPPAPRRGFAAMDPEKVRELARKGGKAAHAAGHGHHFTSDQARDAGRKGGVAPHVRRGRRPRALGPTGTASQAPKSNTGD